MSNIKRRDNSRRSVFPNSSEDASLHSMDFLNNGARLPQNDDDTFDHSPPFSRLSKKAKRMQQAAQPAEPVKSKIALVGQTETQQTYIDMMTKGTTPFIVASGPAGTGKTFPAVLFAIQQLQAGKIKRIVITRPLVNVEEEEVGTLPGGIIEKVSPWMLPILDILKEHFSTHEIKNMLEKEIIEIAPLAFMRGRTFKDVLMIVDEAQNCTPTQFKMLLSRIGYGARIIITGDVEQTDRRSDKNGLADLLVKINHFKPVNFGIIAFKQKDIVRHPAIDEVLTMYA